MLSIPLPRAALEDAHLHLLFYFVAPKKALAQSAWKVPELITAGLTADSYHAQKLEAPADWTKIEQIGNPQNIQECWDNTFAFAYLIMYPKPGQFRADDYYELQVYEGRPPPPIAENVNMPGPYSPSWRDIKTMDADPMGDFAPTPLYLSYESPKPFGPLFLSVSLRVLSGAILDDSNLQFLLEETTSPMDKLATLAKTEGHLLEKTHVHDIAKFYGYLLAQIGKLYVAQLQIGQVYRTAGTFYKSNATLPPLFTLFTYVLSAVVHVECQHPLLQQDFEDSLYSCVPAKFLRDYLEYLSIQLDEVFVSTPTPDPHIFPFSTISSCMCFLLSSLLRRKIQGSQPEEITQNLLEDRFLRDKVVKVIDVFMLVLAAPAPVTAVQQTIGENNKRAVVQNLALLYPYLLGFVGFTTVMRVLRAVISHSFVASGNSTSGGEKGGEKGGERGTKGSPTAITRSTLVLLSHIYQFQPPPYSAQSQTMELFCQCTLLPYIVTFLTSILSSSSSSPSSSISPSSSSPSLSSSSSDTFSGSSPFSTSDFFLELSQFLATLFLSFFPVLHRHALDQSSYFQTWQVSKLHLLTLSYTTAFPIFLGTVQFLQTQCHPYTTIQGILNLALSSFFTLGCTSQNGKLLRQSLPFHIPQVSVTSQFLCETFHIWKQLLEKSPFPGDTCGILYQLVNEQVAAAHVLIDLFLDPIENLSKPLSSSSSSPFSHLLSFVISFLLLPPPQPPSHSPAHSSTHLHTYAHTLHFLHAQCQKRRNVVFQLAREVVPILARLFAAPHDSVRTQALAHTPTTTFPDSELSIPDLALECFVAFLVSNFWADSTFGSIDVALYEFVCSLLTSGAKTQVVQESLENISQFLTRQILKDPMHLFAREFVNRLALEVEFSRKISIFISEMVQLLDDFMLLYRVEKEEVEISEQNEDTLVWAALHLIERGDKLQSPLCIHFADQLVKIHRNFEDRRLELAHAILLKFKLLRKFRGQSAEDVLTEENLELYQEAIGNFNVAHDFESAISVCQTLVSECERGGNPANLKNAAKFLATSAILYKNLATVPRISPLYYAVYFYGSGFPPHLDGATYVYRINETENFTQFTDMMRAQFPNASLLLPGSRTPVIKPIQIIKFLPVLPGIELDKFESSTEGLDLSPQPNELKYKPQHHHHLTTFYTYLESSDDDVTSKEATYTLQVWNRNFVPSYLVDAATFAIPENILNSSSLAPIAPPIHRVQMITEKGTYLPSVSRHVRIAHRFTSLIPAAQACIEWIEVQTSQLLWLIYIFHKTGKPGADWCGVCGKRSQSDIEKTVLAKIADFEKSEPSEQASDWKEIESNAAGLLESPEDMRQSKVAEKYLRHVLHDILNPESNQVVGIKKCWFVLEQENLRKDQMLAKIKQETGKAYIKERKRCTELGLEIPKKPELIDLVPDPLSANLEQKLNELRSLLEYATLLHMRMVSDLIAEGEGEIESGMEAHGELEIMVNL